MLSCFSYFFFFMQDYEIVTLSLESDVDVFVAFEPGHSTVLKVPLVYALSVLKLVVISWS